MTQQSTTAFVEPFSVTYSAKDVILFALAVGFGSTEEHYDSDLRYLYEEHEQFEVMPLWCLALPFWAHLHEERPLLPAFPPPLMSSMGLIPPSSLRNHTIQLQDYPVLHVFQSIEWNAAFPTILANDSCTLQLYPSFKSIQPKPIGTFVTTENVVVHQKTPICSMQSTALILGLSPEYVISLAKNGDYLSSNVKEVGESLHKGEVWFEKVQTIHSNMALLYRIASGDTNQIHVRPIVSEQPLLHGLCTLAIVATCILQKLPTCTPKRLQGKFTKPVFLNDTIRIKIWKRGERLEFDFIVYNQTKGEVCVDGGYFALKQREESWQSSRL